MNATKERYSITVECAGSEDFPAVLRLKGLLKHMLRAHGLRCVTCFPVPPVAEVPPLVPLGASTVTRQPSQPIPVDESWGTAGATGAGGG